MGCRVKKFNLCYYDELLHLAAIPLRAIAAVELCRDSQSLTSILTSCDVTKSGGIQTTQDKNLIIHQIVFANPILIGRGNLKI